MGKLSFGVYFWLMMSPFVYLSYHGWASKNLLDTSRTDKLARGFYIITTIAIVYYALSMADRICK
jgi:hypothetical protein